MTAPDTRERVITHLLSAHGTSVPNTSTWEEVVRIHTEKHEELEG